MISRDREELVPPVDPEFGEEICQCVPCRMGYPCGAAHRRFMESERRERAAKRRAGSKRKAHR